MHNCPTAWEVWCPTAQQHASNQLMFSEDAEPPRGRGQKINDMLQRDYIMRLIQEFLAALQRMLEKKEIESRRETLEKLYDQ